MSTQAVTIVVEEVGRHSAPVSAPNANEVGSIQREGEEPKRPREVWITWVTDGGNIKLSVV